MHVRAEVLVVQPVFAVRVDFVKDAPRIRNDLIFLVLVLEEICEVSTVHARGFLGLHGGVERHHALSNVGGALTRGVLVMDD